LIIGSIDLIGNPIGLINNIGSGLSDLINKPAQGFVQGPLEGGLGVI
jgi:vacuolar protein sorting-associated protein 13A/C